MQSSFCLAFCVVLALAFARPVQAQTPTLEPGGNLTFGTVTTIGPLLTTVSYAGLASAPGNFTVQWFNPGTAATVCTFSVDGSDDNSHWESLSGAQSCTNLVFTGTTTASSNVVTGISSTQYMLAGQAISGTGIASWSSIQAIGTNQLTLTANATASGTVTLTIPASHGMIHFLTKSATYRRINILSYSAADGTTAPTFFYSQGIS